MSNIPKIHDLALLLALIGRIGGKAAVGAPVPGKSKLGGEGESVVLLLMDVLSIIWVLRVWGSDSRKVAVIPKSEFCGCILPHAR